MSGHMEKVVRCGHASHLAFVSFVITKSELECFVFTTSIFFFGISPVQKEHPLLKLLFFFSQLIPFFGSIF